MTDRQRFIDLFGADQVATWDNQRAIERRQRRDVRAYRVQVALVLAAMVVGVMWFGGAL